MVGVVRPADEEGSLIDEGGNEGRDPILFLSGRVNRSSNCSSGVDTLIVGRGVVAPLCRLALEDREVVGECFRGTGGTRFWTGVPVRPSVDFEDFKRARSGIFDLEGVRCAASIEPKEGVDVEGLRYDGAGSNKLF